MNANTDIRQILTLARCYASAKGLKLSTVSNYVCKSGSWLPGMESGKVKNLTITRRDALIARFSEIWPDETPWPQGISRPARRKDAA